MSKLKVLFVLTQHCLDTAGELFLLLKSLRCHHYYTAKEWLEWISESGTLQNLNLTAQWWADNTLFEETDLNTQKLPNDTPACENDVLTGVTVVHSRIAELEQLVSELASENSRLRELLAASRDNRLDSILLSEQADMILRWLENREPESLVAISFALHVKNAIADLHLVELKNLGLVELISPDSQFEKWQLSALGKLYLAKPVG